MYNGVRSLPGAGGDKAEPAQVPQQVPWPQTQKTPVSTRGINDPNPTHLLRR